MAVGVSPWIVKANAGEKKDAKEHWKKGKSRSRVKSCSTNKQWSKNELPLHAEAGAIPRRDQREKKKAARPRRDTCTKKKKSLGKRAGRREHERGGMEVSKIVRVPCSRRGAGTKKNNTLCEEKEKRAEKVEKKESSKEEEKEKEVSPTVNLKEEIRFMPQSARKKGERALWVGRTLKKNEGALATWKTSKKTPDHCREELLGGGSPGTARGKECSGGEKERTGKGRGEGGGKGRSYPAPLPSRGREVGGLLPRAGG